MGEEILGFSITLCSMSMLHVSCIMVLHAADMTI